MIENSEPSDPAPVILDFDGILVDASPCWRRALRAMFAQYGHDYSEAHNDFLCGRHPAAAGALLGAALGLGETKPTVVMGLWLGVTVAIVALSFEHPVVLGALLGIVLLAAAAAHVGRRVALMTLIALPFLPPIGLYAAVLYDDEDDALRAHGFVHGGAPSADLTCPRLRTPSSTPSANMLRSRNTATFDTSFERDPSSPWQAARPNMPRFAQRCRG